MTVIDLVFAFKTIQRTACSSAHMFALLCDQLCQQTKQLRGVATCCARLRLFEEYVMRHRTELSFQVETKHKLFTSLLADPINYRIATSEIKWIYIPHENPARNNNTNAVIRNPPWVSGVEQFVGYNTAPLWSSRLQSTPATRCAPIHMCKMIGHVSSSYMDYSIC